MLLLKNIIHKHFTFIFKNNVEKQLISLTRWSQTSYKNQYKKNNLINFNLNCSNEHGLYIKKN